MNNKKPFKVTVVGDPTVGKTCLLVTYVQKEFPDFYVPTVFDNYSAEITHNGQPYNVSLWDTAGQEEYERLRLLSYPNTDVFLVCYAVDSRTSFKNIFTKWIPELRHNCPKAHLILVATKSDCQDPASVSALEGKDLSKKIGAAKFIECSAKCGTNLEHVFSETVEVALNPPKKLKRKCVIL